MRKEFLVERNGKTFCLYAGLLAEAHERGLKSIITNLVQAPLDENNRVAICQATVVLEGEGREQVFTGIGDAAPNNVAPAMQNCLLRMAETRAKARALRDAINLAAAVFDECGPECDPSTDSTSSTTSTPSTASRRQPAGPRVLNESGVQCPTCHAPTGQRHVPGCAAVARIAQ